jgi:hypothetical protein
MKAISMNESKYSVEENWKETFKYIVKKIDTSSDALHIKPEQLIQLINFTHSSSIADYFTNEIKDFNQGKVQGHALFQTVETSRYLEDDDPSAATIVWRLSAVRRCLDHLSDLSTVALMMLENDGYELSMLKENFLAVVEASLGALDEISYAMRSATYDTYNPKLAELFVLDISSEIKLLRSIMTANRNFTSHKRIQFATAYLAYALINTTIFLAQTLANCSGAYGESFKLIFLGVRKKPLSVILCKTVYDGLKDIYDSIMIYFEQNYPLNLQTASDHLYVNRPATRRLTLVYDSSRKQLKDWEIKGHASDLLLKIDRLIEGKKC